MVRCACVENNRLISASYKPVRLQILSFVHLYAIYVVSYRQACFESGLSVKLVIFFKPKKVQEVQRTCLC